MLEYLEETIYAPWVCYSPLAPLLKEGRYKASGLNPKKFQKQRVASSIRKMQTIRG